MPFGLVIIISFMIKYRTIIGLLNTEPVFYRIFTRSAVDRKQGSYMSRREGESPARGCVQPYLPVWSDEVRKLQLPCEPPSCGNQENWVYTKHGRFYISEEIEKKVGKIYCEYTAIVYATDDANKVLEKINPMLNGS